MKKWWWPQIDKSQLIIWFRATWVSQYGSYKLMLCSKPAANDIIRPWSLNLRLNQYSHRWHWPLPLPAPKLKTSNSTSSNPWKWSSTPRRAMPTTSTGRVIHTQNLLILKPLPPTRQVENYGHLSVRKHLCKHLFKQENDTWQSDFFGRLSCVSANK